MSSRWVWIGIESEEKHRDLIDRYIATGDSIEEWAQNGEEVPEWLSDEFTRLAMRLVAEGLYWDESRDNEGEVLYIFTDSRELDEAIAEVRFGRSERVTEEPLVIRAYGSVCSNCYAPAEDPYREEARRAEEFFED